jgi:two-component system NarL family response regulator
MSKGKAIRVLIVDDHFIVRMGLCGIINMQPDMAVVAEAEDGEEAVRRFREHRPDVTLMDLRMPGMDGIEAIGTIRKEFPQANLLALSTYKGDEFVYRALQAGARGYLLKNIPGDQLLDAIRTVHGGRRYIPAEIATHLADRIHQVDLSARELDVLSRIARGMTNKEIGAELGVQESTVKAHVINILNKLGVNDRTLAVTTAIQRGILHLE